MSSRRNAVRFTRRDLLAGAGFAAVAPSACARATQSAAAAHSASPALLYIGSYSSPQGPEGSKGNGEGIYLFEMNPATGALTEREVFKDTSNPSWLALHPSKRFLYAGEESNDFGGTRSGAVTAFSIEKASGRLTRLNTVSSQGAGPAHVSLHPSGKYVFVANYAGGTFAVLPVLPDGRLADATDVQREQGKVGPAHAASAPRGSFAVSGHDRPHAHMIESHPSGRFVIGCDLGLDQIRIWHFDAQRGKLTAADPASVSVPPGDGPRHVVFHPNGRWLYSLQEEGSTVSLFDFDSASGKLTPRMSISSLPSGFTGTNFTSEIRITQDGRFLYAANRLHDSVACFSVAGDGTPKLIADTPTGGDYPRSFTIDPTGHFLYVCNQRSDQIATFRLDRATGALHPAGQSMPVGTPAVIVFLA